MLTFVNCCQPFPEGRIRGKSLHAFASTAANFRFWPAVDECWHILLADGKSNVLFAKKDG